MKLQFFKRIFGFSAIDSIRILMYHQVLPQQQIRIKNDMIVSVEELEKQLLYIRDRYHTVFFKELDDSQSLRNKLILTFDDGYYNNLQYVFPLLEKYNLKATIFIATALIQKAEGTKPRTLMTFQEIRALNPGLIEIALHSHTHQNYTQLSLEGAKEDILNSIQILQEQQISFTKVLAYPYGKFPKRIQEKLSFFTMLESIGILSAVRIGNRIEYYPWKKKFEIKRIDIKGSDSFRIFKWKLRLGNVKL